MNLDEICAEGGRKEDADRVEEEEEEDADRVEEEEEEEEEERVLDIVCRSLECGWNKRAGPSDRERERKRG
jgi:hypothetical protein